MLEREFALALSLGLSLSLTALDEGWFQLYRGPGDLARLVLAAVVENFGYRQLITLWRTWGRVRALRAGHHDRGAMRRSGTWGRR